VHNGADDNASGTAALLEAARYFGRQSGKPKRRLVFIAFTSEERGLLGSNHYVKNPRYPLEKTVAMLNMDMVGRLSDNKLIVYGTGTATEFNGLGRQAEREPQIHDHSAPRGLWSERPRVVLRQRNPRVPFLHGNPSRLPPTQRRRRTS
jgi:Zn-dependent M28 family amino/carboxypeptidase